MRQINDIFEIGDTVYSVEFGWGRVIDKYNQDGYKLITVKINGNKFTYMDDGRRNPDLKRTLFFDEIIVPKSALKRPAWRANINETYFFVNHVGRIESFKETKSYVDDKLYALGNYFQSEQDAKESKFYKVFY